MSLEIGKSRFEIGKMALRYPTWLNWVILNDKKADRKMRINAAESLIATEAINCFFEIELKIIKGDK